MSSYLISYINTLLTFVIHIFSANNVFSDIETKAIHFSENDVSFSGKNKTSKLNR